MIGETILARTSAQCEQAYNWRDNISLIIGLQSAHLIYDDDRSIYIVPTIDLRLVHR